MGATGTIAGTIVSLALWGLAGAQETRVTLNIKAEPLSAALRDVGAQAGLQILYRAEDVARDGHLAPALIGRLSLQEAFSQLLANTDLTYEFINPKTVRIVNPGRWSRNASSQSEAGSSALHLADGSDDLSGENKQSLISHLSQVAGQTADQSGKPLDQTPTLAEIVVTAQKRAERLQDVPISISVLPGADLDASSHPGVTEALTTLPGVVAFSGWEGGGTQISIRGVGATGPFLNGSSPIGYYVDSMPFGLVRSAFAPNPDAYDLKQIEVLRGPQGTLYGAGGENGVVRILTNDPDLHYFDVKARATVSDTAGGTLNYRADSALNLPLLEGRLALRLVVGYQNQGGWIDSAVRNNVNDDIQRNFRVKLASQVTDDLAVNLSAWSSRDSLGAPSASDGRGKTNSQAYSQPIVTEFDSYGLKVSYEFPSLSVSSSTNYLRYKNPQLLDIGFGAPALYYINDIWSRVYSEELLLNSKKQDPWVWSAGLFYRNGKDTLFETLPSLPGALYYDYSDTSESFAAYGQFGRRFLDNQFEWTLGGRYFHDQVGNQENSTDPTLPPPALPLYRVAKNFNAFTPKAVLTWYPRADLTAYASFAEGFRSGFSQYADIAQIYPAFAQAVDPDRLYNYELGTKGDAWNPHLSFAAAVYYMDWRRVQQTTYIDVGNNIQIVAPVNGPAATGVGTDLSLTVHVLDNLQFGLSGSWNNLAMADSVKVGTVEFFKQGDRLDYSPEYTAAADTAYSFPMGSAKGVLSVSGNYSSKQSDHLLTSSGRPGTLVLAGNDLLFVNASFSIQGGHWSGTLFMDNINNERGGMPAVVATASDEASPRFRPRTYGFQLEYRLR